MKIYTFAFVALIIATLNLAAQDDQTRSITSDDFANHRPVAKRPVGQTTVAHRRRTYKFVRADKNVIRPKTPVKPVVRVDPAVKVTEIGVTMWKLRPPRAGESGYFFPVIDDAKLRTQWLAERVAADTVFASGDKVRFAVESSVGGYLYVIDRETYADGTFGAPFLIFPGSANADNAVQPGILADIPDQREDLPYFKMTPHGNYTGEILTVIISPKPLTAIKSGKDGKITSVDALTALETGADAEIFSRTDVDDKIYSKTESESACGVKARDADGQKPSANPCGVTSRQLTREEPLPQSIYRVKTPAGQPAVAFVRLSVH